MEAAVQKYGWEKGVFCYDGGLTAPYFMARAKSEKATLIGLPGMNVIELMDQGDVHKLNDLGYSLLWKPLGEAKREHPINQEIITGIRAFLTSLNSPVHQITNKDKPMIIGTHSTSGRIVLEMQSNPQMAAFLSRYFIGIVHANPFIDTANSSESFDPLYNHIFETYAKRTHDRTPHETLLGKAYLLRNAAKEGYSGFKDVLEDGLNDDGDEGTPKRAPKTFVGVMGRTLSHLFYNVAEDTMTYGHILELRNAGRALKREFNAQAAAKIPTIFVLSEGDPFSCRRTTEEFFCAPMGVSPIIAKTNLHYPFREDRGALLHTVEEMGRLVTLHQRRQSIHMLDPRQFFAASTKEPLDIPATLAAELFLKDLRNRAGAALQRGAGLLNPAAGLF